MNKDKSKKLIFWIVLFGIYLIILISLIYGFVNKEEESEFSFDACIEKYLFVYEDLCNTNESFYITYPPEMKIIKGKLSIINIDDYLYNVYEERCIKYYKTGCNNSEFYGKI